MIFKEVDAPRRTYTFGDLAPNVLFRVAADQKHTAPYYLKVLDKMPRAVDLRNGHMTDFPKEVVVVPVEFVGTPTVKEI